MAKKKATKKAVAKKNTDQLRKDAIKDIDTRLNGDAVSSKKAGASERKGPAKKATTKKTQAKKPATGGKAKAAKPRKSSGLDAAVQVLATTKEPMGCKDIVDKMLSQGLWFTKGKTPHATIYAAMIREIASKGTDARFEKVNRGRFQIRTEV